MPARPASRPLTRCPRTRQGRTTTPMKPSVRALAGTFLAAGLVLGQPRTSRSASPTREITGPAFALRAANLRSVPPADSRTLRLDFPAQPARFVRVLIHRAHAGPVCLDELEVYPPSSPTNLALATHGALARTSSSLPGYAIHQTHHLNDGLYGNDHSWIAATDSEAWAEIELPHPTTISRVLLSRDRLGQFNDRQPLSVTVRLSLDRNAWSSATSFSRTAQELQPPRPDLTFPVQDLPEPTWAAAVEYAFRRERETWSRLDSQDYLSPLRHDRPASPGGAPYWGRLARLDPLHRTLLQFEQLLQRLDDLRLGLDLDHERAELADLRRRAQSPDREIHPDSLYLDARHAKRRLFLRDPRLAPLEHILFAKRHPLHPSHNYSEHMDSLFLPGGGIHVLHLPRDAQGRLDPARGELQTLFDAHDGIARDPVADFDARTILFAYRPDRPEVAGWQSYWHLHAVAADGTNARRLTEGPFHDFDPLPLPDGALAFMSTRCRSRFLCWEPQAYVLHRMNADGSDVQRISHANLSEWDPVMMRDGRILWTRSEYQDKGADFGHTLWAIRPTGEHPELVFGNDTPYGYGHAREVPGTEEIVCTLISHGDHQGPIALLDPRQGRFNTAAITSITPDTRPQYQMDRSHVETFRDPEPISSDHFLVSHSPGKRPHWGLYVIDRFGNRELLYLDPAISSKSPSPLRPQPRPPILPTNTDPILAEQGLGQFTVQDVYAGLDSQVPRGQARYLQVSQEMPAPLETLPDGEFRSTHPGFQDFYATPIHRIHGPARSYTSRTDNASHPHAFRAGKASPTTEGTATTATATATATLTITENLGWPSYVAKAVLGTVPIAPDGSACFTAPAGRVLYFHLLDENHVELQRMRSVVHLQPGERRSCVGCHDHRASSPERSGALGSLRPTHPQSLTPPPWGNQAFDFERVVQPVLDSHCVRCHDTQSESKLDLRGLRDPDRIPASYRSLVSGGWVHFFDWAYGARHFKAEPLSFGTLRSPLFLSLQKPHHQSVALDAPARRALTAWIDLNCPLWPDYRHRASRPE